MKKKIAVLTGAGISAESGLKTFRDSGGLWEGYDVMDVASIEGWHRNKEKVLEFYNLRRKQAWQAQPNAGHRALVDLEKAFEVVVITQNVDNLHEKAGSSHVVHLHGELSKVKSSVDESYVVDIEDGAITLGDTCPKGGQLRPDVVWFGEMVPMMEVAARHVEECDILLIIGTSLVVYPAAGLVQMIRPGTPIYVIDPSRPEIFGLSDVEFITKTAATGTPALVKRLMNMKA
ncbi:MAG: SIR2 family NAD-dependent protein deacylase [Cyclonatronaceae bacterium]